MGKPLTEFDNTMLKLMIIIFWQQRVNLRRARRLDLLLPPEMRKKST
jgi:hypothetical protein